MSQDRSNPVRKPRVAVTVGDVAGVGPELALAVVSDPEILSCCQPILLGPNGAIQRIASEVGLAVPAVKRESSLTEPDNPAAALVPHGEVDATRLVPGKFSAETGRASFDAVCKAIDLTLQGRCDAIVTGPIQKEAWHLAGTGYLGHTELLADRTNTKEFCMMLTGPPVSTVLCNIHLALADAIESLTTESIIRAIQLGGNAVQAKQGRPPRITVLGLNPHAGEGGLLSRGEEENIIMPAIVAARKWCQSKGLTWTISDPVPPDTAFTPNMRQQTDLHVCMYHDQGLIPLKALSFDDAVNVTLGLPIIRTSVDHGTAMDLAWKGVANPSSFRSAILMAARLCGGAK